MRHRSIPRTPAVLAAAAIVGVLVVADPASPSPIPFLPGGGLRDNPPTVQADPRARPEPLIPPISGGEFHIYTDAGLGTPGLTGSYVNENLRWYLPQDDWRITQDISGVRVDATIDFTSTDWGGRAELGLDGGTDSDWDDFSVQWDGVVEVSTPGLSLATLSDDGSRMWIDLNHDSVFDPSGGEFIDNHWGNGQYPTLGPPSDPIPAGVYAIRIQYEEGSGANVMRLLAPGRPTVRFAYLIPANRAPQPLGVTGLRAYVTAMEQWFQDQMAAHGFGRLGFRYETEADGVTPRIHVVNVAVTDDHLRADLWGNVLNAAAAAGVPVWSPSEIWVLVPEMHMELPDGTVLGEVALGTGGGSGTDSGVAVLGSARLSLDPGGAMQDTTPYDGQTVPTIGPYPLAQDLSFPWFEGATISSVVSSYLGAMAHELTHGFGMPHDGLNDDNFHGNLMGNGCRGMRGATDPDRFPREDTFLDAGEALALSVNRYFTEAPLGTGLERPSVSILTSGPTSPVQGHLEIDYTTSDTDGLNSSLLLANGEILDWHDLRGETTGTFRFRTPRYVNDQTTMFQVLVYDVLGNRRDASSDITPLQGGNHGPVPFCRVTESQPRAGESVLLEAWSSYDPDDPQPSLAYAWDLDGDGMFEVGPSFATTLDASWPSPGVRMARLKVIDPHGAESASAPVPVRVRTAAADVASGTPAPSGGLRVECRGNPLCDRTALICTIEEPGWLDIGVFDLKGKLVRRLRPANVLAPGTHSLTWDGRDGEGRPVASGVYVYKVEFGGRTREGKLVRLR